MDEENKVMRVDTGSDYSQTFAFKDEDHTLGNALRHVLMQCPETDFCGYSVPHPSEPYMHIRLQTKDEPAEEVLKKGLNTLKDVTVHMNNVFESEVERYKRS